MLDTDQPSTAWHTKPLPRSSLREGTNLIAIELHQNTPTSSDLYLDFQILINPSAGADLLRGDGSAVEELFAAVPDLSAAVKDELRSVFAAEVTDPTAFVTLARALRAHLLGDAAGARAELDKLPDSIDGVPAEAEAALSKILDHP